MKSLSTVLALVRSVHRALFFLAMLATTAIASDVDADTPTVLGFAVSGRYPSRLKLYAASTYVPDSAVPFFDMPIRPGQSVTVPFGACLWWKRSIGASNIDWTLPQFACPPRPRRYPGAPSPRLIWVTIEN